MSPWCAKADDINIRKALLWQQLIQLYTAVILRQSQGHSVKSTQAATSCSTQTTQLTQQTLVLLPGKEQPAAQHMHLAAVVLCK